MMDISTLMRNYSRYLLIVFNLFFLFTGIIMISVGISAKAYFNEFEHFLDSKYLYVSDLLIIIGIVIFFIAFFGCCGAMKENDCMTTTYSTLLIVIFILEVLVAVGGIVLKNKTEEFLQKTLINTMQEYDRVNKTEITELWDQVQFKFQCCGVNNYTDWLHQNSTGGELPLSCCKIPTGQMSTFTCSANSTTLYEEGCLQLFGDYIRAHMRTVEGVGIGLAIVQLIAILLSCYLAKQIRSDYETV